MSDLELLRPSWAFDEGNATAQGEETVTEQCYDMLPKDPTDSIRYLTNLNAHKIGWIISGCAALVATIISFYLIIQHSRNYTAPRFQRYIIRIVLMVPIYAIISWFSYIFYREAVYYELIRDCYEAFVIASFFILLVHYIGDNPLSQRMAMAQRKERLHLLFPLFCFTYSPSSPHFLQLLKYGILQYVVIRPTTTVAAVILQARGAYCPENYSIHNGHLYVSIINYISVTVAMYCLLLLYFSMKKELAPYNPSLKFWCVKLVIFFCFWQLVLLSILGRYGVIQPTMYWTVSNISTGLQAILVCFEMIIFAGLHCRAFPYAPYVNADSPRPDHWWSGIVDALNPWDIVREIAKGIKYLVLIILLRRPDPNAPILKEGDVLPDGSVVDSVEILQTEGNMDLTGAVTGVPALPPVVRYSTSIRRSNSTRRSGEKPSEEAPEVVRTLADAPLSDKPAK